MTSKSLEERLEELETERAKLLLEISREKMKKEDAARGARLVCTVDEIARYLGIARNSAYAAVKAGEIPSIRIGKRFLIPIAALEKMMLK